MTVDQLAEHGAERPEEQAERDEGRPPEERRRRPPSGPPPGERSEAAESRRTAGPHPFLVAGAAFVAGILLAKWIDRKSRADRRSHAGPRR